MALLVDREPIERVPLRADTRGAVLVGGTRVPLEVVVEAFQQGDSAEEIAAAYPALALSDVYAVLTYCLRHREEVEHYVAERRRDAAAVRARIEGKRGRQNIREMLLARRKAG